MSDLTPEKLAQLREKFDDKVVGKLPKINCKACSQASTRNCNEHKKSKCRVCGNYITERHIDLDFVGHASVTDRLLEVDPNWTWEPMARDGFGQPVIVKEGRSSALWINLTVCGVTRPGVGTCDTDKGADTLKELIGDALRNAAMRFGVALYLWAKDGLESQIDDHAAPAPSPALAPVGRTESPAGEGDRATSPPQGADLITPAQMGKLNVLLGQKVGTDVPTIKAKVSELAGRAVASRKELTKREASKVIDALVALPDVIAGPCGFCQSDPCECQEAASA